MKLKRNSKGQFVKGSNTGNNCNFYKHGMTNNRFWRIWTGILGRCNNKNHSGYYKYGAKGIKVCKRWLKFENFRDDMYQSYQQHVEQSGEKNTTIDRFPNKNGNYCKSNCRWATLVEQNINRKNTIRLRFNNSNLTMREWSEKLNIPLHLIKGRYYRKYTVKKILQSNKYNTNGKPL